MFTGELEIVHGDKHVLEFGHGRHGTGRFAMFAGLAAAVTAAPDDAGGGA
jgi:hypothetical protein